MICRIVQAFLSLLVGTISARYLGPSNYGLINYATSIVAFMVPIVQLGLRHILVQEIINNPEREGKTLGTSLLLSFFASLLGIIGVIVFSLVANRNEMDTIIVCTLTSISLIFQCLEMIQYWFQAKLLSKYVAIVSLFAYIITSSYKIFLLVTQQSVRWFALSYALDFCVISLLLYVLYRRLGTQKLEVSFSVAKQLLSKSRYYIISGVMVTLFSYTDHVMLTIMHSENENGIYSAAFACASILSFVYAAIIDSVRPAIFEAKKYDQSKFEKNVIRLYSLIFCLGFLQSFVFTFISPYIVSFLYGEQYTSAISVLRILTWYTAFSYTGTVRNIWILAEGKQKVIWKINLFGAALNIIGNAVLIPIIGAEGAAIASVATQFFTNFVISFWFPTLRKNGLLMLRSLHPRNIKEMVLMIRKR